jgi:hypothetical protein
LLEEACAPLRGVSVRWQTQRMGCALSDSKRDASYVANRSGSSRSYSFLTTA